MQLLTVVGARPQFIKAAPGYCRPTEVETLLGDASKAKKKLLWLPRTGFAELVAEMVREDLRSAEKDEIIKRHGHKVDGPSRIAANALGHSVLMSTTS